MFHKIDNIAVLPGYKLSVHFIEGMTKIYDVSKLFGKWEMFDALRNEKLFKKVRIDQGGYGVVWNDDIDISCDELWANGETQETPFDGIMSFSDATKRWKLNESTLRKAVSYGKLVEGVDAMKYGKQWVVATPSMIREYGDPDAREEK